MKEKIQLILVSLIVISLCCTAVTGNNSKKSNEKIFEQISYKNVNKLEWYSPNGELPGTYQEYLKSHPLKTGIFSTIIDTTNKFRNENQLSILVDENLYPSIENKLNQYIQDLEFSNYSVHLETVNGGTPEEIKSWINQRYDNSAKGILLIGDVTAAWAEVSGSVFPSDLFYMDLDGNWEDNNHDDIYESHDSGSGDMGPELYVARIYATSLNYDSEANMVNDYLEKVHRYKIGDLIQPWRGLEYVEEDWYDMNIFLNNVYEENVDRYDYGYYTTGEDYLNKMDLGQHFVQVCAHSYSGGHHFGTRPTESASYLHTYVFCPEDRNAKLLLGSDDGIKVWLNGVNVYTNDRYGNWYNDAYIIDINLSEGWNSLLLKISQRGSTYLASARIADSSYNSFDDLQYQINNPDLHGSEGQFVRSWLVNGFHQDSSDNFWEYLTTNYLGVDESTVTPTEGQSMGGKIWTKFDSGYPFVDFSDYEEGDYGVTYAYSNVNSDFEQSCQLWLGYDDGICVWLNSEEILLDNRFGDFMPDMNVVNVNLESGDNHLLIKVSEWMGSHGFSARFCQSDGSYVQGLGFDPEMEPISHIGTWLANGPYLNPNQQTRLSQDYLGNESEVRPSQGDPAPLNIWQKAIGNGQPFDIGEYYNGEGDWVYSETIQQRDPPVLFYNLFSCGPGRFTDENYLAGAYIYHTSYGLITIASSKSGSMLNFQDFTEPLGENKCMGFSLQQWFESQAPFELWEKEWYYGLILNGDPTLKLEPDIISDLELNIIKPENALYFRDKKIKDIKAPVAIGKLTIKAEAYNENYNITKVEFYIDEELEQTITEEPYDFNWNKREFLKHNVKVIAYDDSGRNSSKEFIVWKFF